MALRLLRGIAEVLAYVHRSGVIHRDLHAPNILLEKGSLDSIKLADFGTARDYSIQDLSESDQYKTFRPIGAMGHCAPEKWVNPHHAGPESDIFSLGVMFFHATTGQYPFWQDSYVSLYESIIRGKPRASLESIEGLSGKFCTLLDAMMNPSQIFRIATAEDVIAECNEILES